jgi:hypothetical protein
MTNVGAVLRPNRKQGAQRSKHPVLSVKWKIMGSGRVQQLITNAFNMLWKSQNVESENKDRALEYCIIGFSNTWV